MSLYLIWFYVPGLPLCHANCISLSNQTTFLENSLSSACPICSHLLLTLCFCLPVPHTPKWLQRRCLPLLHLWKCIWLLAPVMPCVVPWEEHWTATWKSWGFEVDRCIVHLVIIAAYCWLAMVESTL